MQKLLLLLLCFGLVSCKDNPRAQNSSDNSPDTTIEGLRTHLSLTKKEKKDQPQPEIDQQAFAKTPISKDQAEEAIKLILADRISKLRAERKKEHDAKSITIKHGDAKKTLRYEYRTFGKKPADGHSLYISMHGGGGAPARVNDGQWRNQIRLYEPAEGIYVAPRAPTDTWDLWHMDHIDPLFDRLIENFIAIEGINPNKVYVLGYSAGGDGTYQLAPRMADRWAGAAMMAGHPGDAQTYNLRNLAYFIQCGGKDTAYDRHKLAAEWGAKLDELSKKNPGAYPHKWIVYPEHGHWMKLDCKQAVPWMAKHTRNPWPKKLHWHQDNVTHTRFHWLANPDPKPNQLITAEIDGQTITLTTAKQNTEPSPFKGEGDYTPLKSITLRLSDQLLDLDKPLIIKDSKGNNLFKGKVSRTILDIHHSLQQRPDPTSAATATIMVELPE